MTITQVKQARARSICLRFDTGATQIRWTDSMKTHWKIEEGVPCCLPERAFLNPWFSSARIRTSRTAQREPTQKLQVPSQDPCYRNRAHLLSFKWSDMKWQTWPDDKRYACCRFAKRTCICTTKYEKTSSKLKKCCTLLKWKQIGDVNVSPHQRDEEWEDKTLIT